MSFVSGIANVLVVVIVFLFFLFLIDIEADAVADAAIATVNSSGKSSYRSSRIAFERDADDDTADVR